MFMFDFLRCAYRGARTDVIDARVERGTPGGNYTLITIIVDAGVLIAKASAVAAVAAIGAGAAPVIAGAGAAVAASGAVAYGGTRIAGGCDG